jgi:hypothetical protein
MALSCDLSFIAKSSFASPASIRILRPFVASAEQQDHLASGNSVVHPVSWPDVDTQLPNSVTAKLVVPKVAGFYPVDAPVDGYSGFRVAELAVPLQLKVLFIRGKVVADFVHRYIFV